jgi:hypothetical protein
VGGPSAGTVGECRATPHPTSPPRAMRAGGGEIGAPAGWSGPGWLTANKKPATDFSARAFNFCDDDMN